MNSTVWDAKTRRLFLLFAQLPNAAEWEPLLADAKRQVMQSLRPGANAEDERLCYYAAALANLSYRRILAAESAKSPTYAGAVPSNCNESAVCAVAVRLEAAYRAHAADLLRDDSALLIGI